MANYLIQTTPTQDTALLAIVKIHNDGLPANEPKKTATQYLQFIMNHVFTKYVNQVNEVEASEIKAAYLIATSAEKTNVRNALGVVK